MRISNKHYVIAEYEGFTRGETALGGYQPLPVPTFDALESFVLANHMDLLALSARKGVGKLITARNYVGILTMKDGTVIEILPKIYGAGMNEADTKRIFLTMLKTAKDIPFKTFNEAALKTNRLHLFEIFISMFVGEAGRLLKQGLCAAYAPVEENGAVYKGKLLVTQHLKRNYLNRAQFYRGYDEWHINRPENRLIKTALHFLLGKTQDDHNKRNIVRLLNGFKEIPLSADFETDYARCEKTRPMAHYDKALSWCRIFLRGNSFTVFSGSEVALALLFPMERVFECYAAAKLRQQLSDDITLRTQDERYSLFDEPTRAFGLRPDIVLQDGQRTVVVDTKWKVPNENNRNFGISQADMYQMYAYAKKYQAEKVVLLYPRTEPVRGGDRVFTSRDGVRVAVRFVDLLTPDFAGMME